MKKLTLLVPLFAGLFLVGCATTPEAAPTSPVVVNQPVEKKVELPKEDDNNLGMIIHMCLMGGGENCDEYLDPANKDKYAELVQEQCDLMPGMDACDTYFGDDHGHDGSEGAGHDDDAHGDLTAVFEGVEFTTTKEFTVDGYDIVIKHKDDIHAGEKITRTVSVMQGGLKLDGFEKIDGDDGVGIVKHPVGKVDHLHPLAYTDSSLTFSVATEELGTYQVITQFKHDGKIVTIPYQVDILLGDDNHGH